MIDEMDLVMDQTKIIIPKGTKIHSLYDGSLLALMAVDYCLGDTFKVESFTDYAGEMPKTGDSMSFELMASIAALCRAYMVKTGIRLKRMDTNYPMAAWAEDEAIEFYGSGLGKPLEGLRSTT